MSKGLVVNKCADCGALFIPPRFVCTQCNSENITNDEVPGHSHIYTFTVIRMPPEQLKDDAPYTLAIVEFPKKLRVTGRMVQEYEDLKIGDPVNFVRRDEKGYWFQRV